MAGMIWDGACNFVQAMPRYLHKIERLDKLASVPHKVREETHNSASAPLSCGRGFDAQAGVDQCFAVNEPSGLS